MARRWATEQNLPCMEFLPSYEHDHDFQAPLRRNSQIVDASDFIVAFVNAVAQGKLNKDSRGTWDTIRKAQKADKPVTIFHV